MTSYELFDNTRVSDFKRCARYFYFRHRRHWVRSGPPSLPLGFGSAWHEAQDALWRGVNAGKGRKEVLEEAHHAFNAKWIESGLPADVDIALAKELSPRTPMVASEMLYAYYDKRERQIKEWELVEVERPFAVPLRADRPNLFYIGRMDKIVRPSASRMRTIEHKTTTASKLSHDKEPKIRGIYLESYSPNSQVDGYLFALTMLYGDLATHFDVWVDAALVNAKGEDFQWVPVERQRDQINAWLWEVNDWIDAIRREDGLLAQATPSDPYLAAFRKDTSRCFDFNTQCPYLDLCKARPNPLTWHEPPPGYESYEWNPLDHIGTPEELK